VLLCCASESRRFDKCSLYTRPLWALSCSTLLACVLKRGRSWVRPCGAAAAASCVPNCFCCWLAGWLPGGLITDIIRGTSPPDSGLPIGVLGKLSGECTCLSHTTCAYYQPLLTVDSSCRCTCCHCSPSCLLCCVHSTTNMPRCVMGCLGL
jgi:hypothetical protein